MLPKSFNTKKLCTLSILLAISVVLGALSIRIGSGIKISFKFVPVFTCSALFGPILGGLLGALSDFISFFSPINQSTGPYIPQLSFIEILYGISFGLSFYNSSFSLNFKNIAKLIICLLLNTAINAFLTSYILKDLLCMTYINTVVFRFPALVVNLIIQFVLIVYIIKFMPLFKKMLK